MVTCFRSLVLKRVFRCDSRNIFIMPKRSLQNPPEKKLKPNQVTVNMTKNVNTTAGKHNLNADFVDVEKMQAENRNDEIIENSGNDNVAEKPRIKVEYLDIPVKSENDKKEYRVIKLENGLTALLIADLHSPGAKENGNEMKVDAIPSEIDEEDDEESDEEDEEDDEDDEEEEEEDDDEQNNMEGMSIDDTDLSTKNKRVKREEKMAACGLCVGVGTFSDPPEIPGLAHFLEHMVFMGSEKYPQENDFDVYIKKRGGSDNAFTESEQTTFHFEVQEKHLLSALDRFAQFFIKPLMNRDAITREREAVESEFQMALPSDSNRRDQLFCSFAKANHPATKFSWGNLVTLRDNVTDEKLYEELHKFRERHYSAHRMKVAIQARLPLDKLEEYVTQCFANVPSNGLPAIDFSNFKGAESFDTPSFRRMYKIKPIKDVCKVELTWAMPPLHDLYKSKPHQYISWIIGHEGKGSLISYLRKKMWCLDIFSGNGESGFEYNTMYALFTLSLILTDEGHEKLDDVLNAIFSFINLMRREGPQERIYDEIYKIEETNFRFTDEVPPAENVEDMCENMHFYPPCDYITGNDLFFEYNPEAIKNCMSYLSPDDVNIIVFDKKFSDKEFEKVETWFNTKYTDMEIPQEWIERWRTIDPLPEFNLPLPNVYLTDDFSLIPLPDNVPKYPTKIYSDNIVEIWYRQDPKFRLPECYMYFYLISPMPISSPKKAALMDLFVGILKQLLVEELYPATTAELNHTIYTSEKGIILKVSGYNQKLPLVLTTVAKCIADSSTLVTRDLYEVMKKEQIKEYYNTFLKPGKLAKDVRLSILMLIHWPVTDKHAAICGVEFEEFQDFIRNFTNHIYIQSLVQGNMMEADVIKNIRESIETMKCGALLPNTTLRLRVTQIPLGTHYYKIRNFNKADVNSVVTNYYQSGVSSIRSSVIIELLIMIMEEPLFNQLRTKEQLGYNVFCLMRDIFGVLGYSITVCTQADKYTTEHVDERIEKFLQTFNETLMETSEKELASVKEALMKLKQCADIHLKEEVSRNWAEITTGKYKFDRVESELVAIEHIKLEELRDWMTNHTISGNNLRKLSMHIIGATLLPDSPESPDPSESPESPCNDDTMDHEPESSGIEINSESKREIDGNMKYSLLFVPTSKSDAEKAPGNYITDIEEFKRGLYVYPLDPNAL